MCHTTVPCLPAQLINCLTLNLQPGLGCVERKGACEGEEEEEEEEEEKRERKKGRREGREAERIRGNKERGKKRARRLTNFCSERGNTSKNEGL